MTRLELYLTLKVSPTNRTVRQVKNGESLTLYNVSSWLLACLTVANSRFNLSINGIRTPFESSDGISSGEGRRPLPTKWLLYDEPVDEGGSVSQTDPDDDVVDGVHN